MATKRILKRISPLQLGKVSAALYGGISIIVVPFVLIGGVFASFSQHSQIRSSGGLLGLGMGVVLAILIPLVYTAIGFVLGIIGAFVYNLVANWIGGIEVEVE
jgi:hypothetical protein